MSRSRKSSKTSDGKVYIARCQDLYKIGWTGQRDPSKRVAELRTANPFPVELVGAIPGSMTLESNLHTLFASKRVSGEWFSLDAEDVNYILSLAPEPEPPVNSLSEIDLDELERYLAKASARTQRAFVRAVRNIQSGR